MNLYEIIDAKASTTNLIANNKEDCLQKLAQLLSASIKNVSADTIYESLNEREKNGSTGFEDGIAIPHAKIKGLEKFTMAVAISRKGIDFNSLDKKKSQLFFCIVGPDDEAQTHLQILAQVSRISRNKNARREMLNATTNIALKEAFIRYTTSVVQKSKKQKNKLMLMVLNEVRFMEDILNLFTEIGIKGVNIFDSTSMSNQLSNIPLFSGFLDFLGERPEVSKTILAPLSEDEIQSVIDGVEEIMGDLDKHTGAVIMTMDISFMKGSMQIL